MNARRAWTLVTGAGSRRLALVATGIGVVGIGVGAAAFRDGGAPEPNGDAATPRPVRAADVRQEVVTRPIVAPGTLGPKDEIALSFKVGGVIAQVAVDAGQIVRAGQTLAALHLRETDAAVARARSASEKAERDLARARRLYADSVVTLVQMQDAETAAQVARADLETAAFDRRYAVIVAPTDGSILRRSAEPGETVSPGTPVLVLGSHSRGTVVRVSLADRDVVRLERGDSGVAHFDALPERAFEGSVTEIAAAAEPATGTYEVEVALRGAGDLAAGLVGRVEIYPAGGVRAAVVPVEAIFEADGNEATVFALAPDGTTAERRRVRVAFLLGDRVAIAAGLEGVRRVLTEGAAYLEDGAAVRVEP